MLATGQTFGEYEIEDYAGSGGMGLVYRARDCRLGRLVALKVIAPHLARDPLVRQRLNRESQILAALDHPNVLPIYDADEVDGSLYLASRWVEGRDLGQMVRDVGPLDPRDAIRIIGQVASALAAAHDIGLVHRDVKPSNILVAEDGHVYLADFGVARRSSDVSGITGTEQLLGTLDYVAPEQIRGERFDLRSDIYSLGGALYTALTARVPFEHEAHAAKLYAHLSAERPRPSAVRAELAPEFDDVVVRALDTDPAGRQQNAREFERELNRVPLTDTGGNRPREFTQSQPRVDLDRHANGNGNGNGHGPVPFVRAPDDRRRDGAAGAAAAPITEPPAPPAPEPASPERRRWRMVVTALVLLVALVPALILLALESDKSAGPQTIGIGKSASGIAVAAGHVWVAEPGMKQLVGVPVGNLSGTERRMTLHFAPSALAGSGSRLIVAGGKNLIDIPGAAPRNGRLTGLPAPAGALAAGRSIWVAGKTKPYLLRIDSGPGGDRAGARSTLSSPASAVAVSGGSVWVAHPSDGTVGRVARATQKGQLLTHVGGRPVALAVTGSTVWVADSKRNVVERLNARTGKQVDIPTSVPGGPMAIAADGRQVWVARKGDHTVTVIDARSGRPLRDFGVANNPVGITLTGDAAWIASAGGQLTRIPRSLVPIG